MHSPAILIDKLSERLLTQADNQSVTTERGEDGLQKLKGDSNSQLATTKVCGTASTATLLGALYK